MSTKKLPMQKAGSPNDFQTPIEAVLPLLPYINPHWTVWEPAAGKGNIVRALWPTNYVVASDTLPEEDISVSDNSIPRRQWDFLTHDDFDDWDVIVTNPPYSLKDKFIERCYELGKPWAMLMPVTALAEQKRVAMYRKHGIELIIPDRRYNFETPNAVEESSAWFFTMWFCSPGFTGEAISFWAPEAVNAVEQPSLFGRGA